MGWLKQHNRITVSQLDHRSTQGSWMYKWVNTFGFCGHEERNGKKNGYWAVAGQPTVPAIDSKYLKWFLDNFTVRWETYQSIVWTVFIISILLLYFLFCVSIQSYWQWLRKLWIGFNNLKSFTVWITTNCGKFLKRWEYQTTLPAPWEIYAGQEATVRTRHGTMNWFKIGKGVHQGCILSPCLFNFYGGIIIMSVLCFWAANTFSWAAIWDSSTTLCPVLYCAVLTGLHCSPSIQNWANSPPQLCPLPILLPNWILERLCNDLKGQVLETTLPSSKSSSTVSSFEVWAS